MAYQEYPPQGRAHPPPPPQTAPYQLTRDEKRVLKECAQESFYRRCVPLMSALGLGAFYGTHLGYFKKSVKYGATPKVAAGLVIGFIAGKLSYKNACEEKILRLPGGRLKESVLQSRQQLQWNGAGLDDGGVYKDATISYALPPYAAAPFRSARSSLTSEMDNERSMDSFDDSFRIRSEYPDELENSLPAIPPAQSISYDELRNRNRDDYEARRKLSRPVDDYSSAYSGQYSAQSSPAAGRMNSVPEQPTANRYSPMPPENRNAFEQPTRTQTRVPGQRTNFYGDVVERSD